MKVAKKGHFRKIFLIFAFMFPISLIVSFQNCGNNLRNNNYSLSNVNSSQCPLMSQAPEIGDQSLCIGIRNCESNFCSFEGGDIQANVKVDYGDNVKQEQCDRTLANLSLHSCHFGTSAKARITQFGVNRESSIITVSVEKPALEELIENEDEDERKSEDTDEDEDTEKRYNLRLISFYSLRCGTINENSILTSGSLHKVRLDSGGNIILSDYSGIICGSVHGTTLECTHNIPSGCSFGLTIWSYDSQNNFSEGKTIQI